MVVDQRTLRANMLRNNIGANVFNKLTGQQAQAPAQQPTNTPITQTRGAQGLQQQPETYKVITNKFPTYDVKDIMGFGPQAVKNQLGFANTVSQYNRLQAQANANTDPNVRYNLTKPELTNKQTLQIQQATPETNEQGLKINKTNSFKDLVIDLKNGADQGGSLNFMKFRDLYPEYVENWDEVLDLYESIKANPAYTTEQITQNAQKQYPELFGIKDNLSDKDKTTALKKLYDEMVSNKQNGIQLTQQDIIDRYPEYANTEDINTVMEVQNLMNRDRKSTPTFNDIYENFESLTKGDVEVGNTEKEQIKKDLANLDKLEARQYNYLSDEGKEYVKLLGTAKAITDELKKNYWIPNDVSERDVLQEVKNKYPDIYSQLTNGVSENVQVSDKDRKLLDGGSTAKSAGKFFKGNLLEFVINTEAGLGDLISTLGNANADFYRDLATALGHGDEWNDEKFREGSTLLGDTLTRAAGWQKEDLESKQRYKEFQEENQKSFKQAMKDGDWTTMIGKSTGLIGQTLPALIASAASGGATGVGFATFLPSSYERALEDLEADESIKLTDNQKRGVALLMGSVESAIEEMSLNMMFPGLKADGGLAGQVLNKIPGMKNALLRFAVQTELGATSESMEEVAQEFSNNLIAKAAGSDRDMGEFKDYRDIFTETFLSSQLISALGGAGEGINQAKINQIQQQIQEQADLRNKVLEGQAIMANDFNEFANAVEVVPGTTTEELQQVWNNTQQKKQELEEKANSITSNSYNNVTTPTYERATIKDTVKPKITANESQQYTDLLDEMVKNGEITKEDRKKVEMSLGVFTRNTEKTEQPQTEGLAEVAETPKTEKKTGWWTRKMSGLDNETITRIENNPYISSYWNNAVNMVEKEGLSMDNGKIIEQPMQELGEELLKRIEKAEKDLGEDGRMYRLIKDIKEAYDLSDSRKGIEGVLKNYDITTNEDGKLDFSNSQFIKAEDTNAISRAVELLNNTDLTNITPKQYWNLRKKLSSLSGFDKGTSKDGEAVVRQLRHLVDQLAKDNIPGLKKVDEIFSKELKYLEEIKQGLVYQQGERKGQIKDNFYSILKTINNQNRQQMNQRLEKIMPDLSDKVEAINMLPKLLKAYAVKSRLIEVGARNIGKVGGAVTGGIPGLVVGYVFDEITGKVSKNLRKNAINKIVNNMSDTAKQRLEDIAAKQEEKETLTQEERETLNQVKAEIEKIIEQENNEQKPQTQPETEKKSEKKINKAEQVQAKKKNNQNQKPKTKGLAKINETKEETKTEQLVKTDETKSQSESKIDNRVQEQPLFNVETKQEGLAAISVKVENGKVVKESETEQESETVETPQEFEVLPADVSVYDESKTTGPKRISPDRGGWWQQLTPKEAIDKKIEQITKDRQRRTEQYDKKLDILNGYIEKFGDSISQNDRSKEATEARKTIRNEIINPYRLGNFFTAGALGQIKEVFERWKSQQNTEITDKNREDINRDYIQHVKEDISHGYRYPEAVLSYNPEFRTAVDNRARYEKGLYTSFSTDDTRIVDYKKDQIGAGMKRQDGKELTQEQKDEIANGVINYQETMGIDIKRLAENNNWVYVHLNGKNPFLMGSQGGIAGLYRGSVDEKGRSTASISVGGTESYQIREDGKIVTKKKKTTMAHELTHALDALSSRKLLSESAYNDLRLKFNDYDSRGLHHSSYWTSKSEITARMVEEYVAVQNGDTEIFNEKGYWDQETYNSVIEPEINKIKNNFFQEYKEGIGGDSIEQIKADAIIRGLAEINNF